LPWNYPFSLRWSVRCGVWFALFCPETAPDPFSTPVLLFRRVALGVAPQGSHKSVRAQLRHTARQATASPVRFAIRCRHVDRVTKVRCPCPVSRQRLCGSAPPSLGRVLAVQVPRRHRYYGVLRFPAVRSVPLRFLRKTVTTPCVCVRISDQARRRLGARGFQVRQPLGSLLVKRWRRSGVPSSWGTLVCLCPVLGPRQDQRSRPYTASAWPPFIQRRRLLARGNFGAQ